MRTFLVTFAVLALAGCGARQEAADTAASSPPPAAAPAPAGEAATPGASDAVTAAAPQLIESLTDQKLVYECPQCGMDFDAAGKCSMDGAELVATNVEYVCPKDGQAVEKAGKCPRCPMNARIEKTAMTGTTTAGKN